MSETRISVILPCLNEHQSLPDLLADLAEHKPEFEIIVVDDGSEPPISAPPGITIVRHPQRLGNGAAVKTGVRHASGAILVLMDADGQHNPKDIPVLLAEIERGYDMVVGARPSSSQASWWRRAANSIFNKLASVMTGRKIEDLTSGFRAARAEVFRHFLYLLPNGFSYPATSTMAFFRCGYSVAYVLIQAQRRQGESKIRLIRDGFRFFLIILRIGALFSPMRLFLPIAVTLLLIATSYYAYTYFTIHRFTNMSAVLYLSAMFTFLFGIISEQVSSLHYRYSESDRQALIARDTANATGDRTDPPQARSE